MEDRKITIVLTPKTDGGDFVGESFDPTPLLIKFISSINTIPPRRLKDYGPVFPTYTAGYKGGMYLHEGNIDVKTDITLVYNFVG